MRIVLVAPPISAQLRQHTSKDECQSCDDGNGLIQLARNGDTHADSLALSLARGNLCQRRSIDAGAKVRAQKRTRTGFRNEGATRTSGPAVRDKMRMYVLFLTYKRLMTRRIHITRNGAFMS